MEELYEEKAETRGEASAAELACGEKASQRGREHPASGQAPAGGVGENPRQPRRERPLSSGSELQVLSSEAKGAGGAAEAKRAWERGASSFCFEDNFAERP